MQAPLKPEAFIIEIRKSRMPRRRRSLPTLPRSPARSQKPAAIRPNGVGTRKPSPSRPPPMWSLTERPARTEKRAQRFDIFARFYRDGSLERRGLEAVRRLQEDIAILHRTTRVSGTGITTPMTPNATWQ